MSVCFHLSSVAQSCPPVCDPTDYSAPGFSVHHQLLEHTQTHIHWVGEAIQPSPPLMPRSVFPKIRVFSNESVLCTRWPNYWSFSFNISRSNEYSGLISFRMSWLDLLAVQGTLKSLLQHHSSKASILRHSAIFTVQLSHPYMTTGKTIALTRQTFVGTVMSLLFNLLSRLVIAFLPSCLVLSDIFGTQSGLKGNRLWDQKKMVFCCHSNHIESKWLFIFCMCVCVHVRVYAYMLVL